VEQWDELEVRAGSARTLLRRTSEGWHVFEPVKAWADEQTVRSLLRALGTPLRLKASAPRPEQLAGWGLAQPRFQVRAASATARLMLRGGDEDSFDGSVALQKEGDASVYALPGGAAQALSPDTYALRDKEVLPHRSEWVWRVMVQRRGAKRYILVREQSDRWRVEGGDSVSASAVTRALAADAGLRFLSFDVPAPKGPPETQIAWGSKNGVLVILALYPAPEGWVGVLGGARGEVQGLLPREALEAWRTGPERLRPASP
jgi:hypothetical protein